MMPIDGMHPAEQLRIAAQQPPPPTQPKPEAPQPEQTKEDKPMDIQQILSDRQKAHGDFADNARIMQNLKDLIRDESGYDKLDATKREALDMILHKVGRIINGNPEEPDHWADIAGYAILARDRVKK